MSVEKRKLGFGPHSANIVSFTVYVIIHRILKICIRLIMLALSHGSKLIACPCYQLTHMDVYTSQGTGPAKPLKKLGERGGQGMQKGSTDATAHALGFSKPPFLQQLLISTYPSLRESHSSN